MAGDDGEEAFEALAAALDDLVGEAVREDLAGERRDVHARRLALEDVPEGLEVRVAPPDDRVAQLERGDVRLERGYQTEGSGERGLEFETKKGGKWGLGNGEWGRGREALSHTYLAHDLVVGIHLPPETCRRAALHVQCSSCLQHTAKPRCSPCVWGLRTSISRKLSGTLYISSICSHRGSPSPESVQSVDIAEN